VPEYDEQIIARAEARVQPQADLWFPTPSAKLARTLKELQTCAEGTAKKGKKRAAVSGGFKVDNREASNRVTGATRCPKRTAIVIPEKA
jgi:hypothetical protein